MEEKTYRLMHITGAANIAVGIISIVVGVALGVVMIVSGGSLLSHKKNILF